MSEIELRNVCKEKCEFLEMAIADKTTFRKENEKLREELKFIHIHTNEVASDMIV